MMTTVDEAKGDEIRLTLPRDSAYYGVAHLVVGGLAVRLNLTLEKLEDLKLAVDELLDQGELQDEVTVVVRIGSGSITARVGPLDGEGLQRKLAEEGPDGAIGLGRLLRTVVNAVQVVRADGADWVEFTKETAPRPLES